jgi:hypothetical protein
MSALRWITRDEALAWLDDRVGKLVDVTVYARRRTRRDAHHDRALQRRRRGRAGRGGFAAARAPVEALREPARSRRGHVARALLYALPIVAIRTEARPEAKRMLSYKRRAGGSSETASQNPWPKSSSPQRTPLRGAGCPRG